MVAAVADPLIVLAGGGSAGHVNPLLALAHELRDEARLRVLGTREGLESELVPAAGLDLITLERVPLPRSITPQWFSLPGRWRRASATAREALTGADALVGFGGYVSAPAYLAARKLGVPTVVHEQNSRPGLSNRLGARHARAVGVTFPDTLLPRAELVGLPLRAPIAELVAHRKSDRAATSAAGAAALGLLPGMPTLLVTGGSLGAARLNEIVPSVARDLLDAGVQVLHLTGKGKSAPVLAATDGLADDSGPQYHVREYLIDMEHALACADLVIGRAGSSTVSELAALGIPAVYVPLPHGNGEQALNATPVVEAGGGLLISNSDLSGQWLRERVVPLLRESGRAELDAMAATAAQFGITDGARNLAALVRSVIGQRA